MTRSKLVAVLAAVAALGACSPHSTWAARLAPSGLPQFVDIACDAPDVERVVVQAPDDDAILDEKDPVIWEITFARPTRLREITVGQVPEGAEEKVAWQPPKGDQDLGMSAFWKGGGAPHIEFTLDKLRDGKVQYQFEYLSADEFAKKQETCVKA